MFGDTPAVLPARNGLRPNLLHAMLHLAILALLSEMARGFRNGKE